MPGSKAGCCVNQKFVFVFSLYYKISVSEQIKSQRKSKTAARHCKKCLILIVGIEYVENLSTQVVCMYSTCKSVACRQVCKAIRGKGMANSIVVTLSGKTAINTK